MGVSLSQQAFAPTLPTISRPGRRTQPDQEQLIRLLRDSDSATRTLAAWTGNAVRLELISRDDDRLRQDEFADLDVWQPVPVQRREVRLLDGEGRTLSEATATVVLGRLPYQTVRELREGDAPLGLLLSPLHARRHTLSITRGDRTGEEQVLFDVTARMDVAGRPVAYVRERYLVEALP
jgi:chorismate-pyruvate lyase